MTPTPFSAEMSLWLFAFGPYLAILWLIALAIAIFAPKTKNGKLVGFVSIALLPFVPILGIFCLAVGIALLVPKTKRGKIIGVALAVSGTFTLGTTFYWLDYRDSHLSWSEEVKLHDGTVILINRTVTLRGPAELGQRRTPSTWTIEASYPQPLKWTSDGGTRPRIFDVYQGTPYIAVTIGAGMYCERHGGPKNGAVFYKLDPQQGWTKVPVEQFPRVLDTNLMLNVVGVDSVAKKFDDAKGLMSLKAKEQRDSPRSTSYSLWTWIEKYGVKACRP